MYPEKTQSRVVYWPETLCFRGEVVSWQQVSSRNARILKSTVTPLRPQHPLDFLKQKCTSCCQTTITTVVFNKYHRHGYRWAKWIRWIINNWVRLRVCNDPAELLQYCKAFLRRPEIWKVSNNTAQVFFDLLMSSKAKKLTFKIDFHLAFVYSWLPQRAAAGSWSPETEGWTWGLGVDWFEFRSDTSATLGATDTSSPNYEQKNTGCDERNIFTPFVPKTSTRIYKDRKSGTASFAENYLSFTYSMLMLTWT